MPIRLAQPQDIPHILAIYAPYVEQTAISFEYTVPTREAFEDRFAKITAHFPWLVWEQDGVILGYAYGSLPFERAAYQWCAEASIYLRQDARGKGIGKALYHALEALLQLQGYRKVYAIITTANQQSVSFHEAMGYRFTATMPDCGWKLGNWYGTVWMEKLLNPPKIVESPPISIGAIVDLNTKLENILDKISLSFPPEI